MNVKCNQAPGAVPQDARTPYSVEKFADRPAVLRLDGPPPADPAAWAAEHRGSLRDAVAEYGAVVLRGLGLADAETVGRVGRELLDAVMEEREAFAGRKVRAEGVYSSSEWPADQPMCMHHELSYRDEVPGTLLFACLTPPSSGGVTGFADSGQVLEALDPALVARFERQGWRLDRNYTDTVGVGWKESFGVDTREAVAAYCAERGIEVEWRPEGDLRTRQRSAAVLRHPVTGDRGWFNQIAFLNEWTLDPVVREYLTFEFGADGLPFNSRYGDGGTIAEDTVLTINGVYEKHTLREPWQAGDLMIVDNLRMAHSREPYEGPRDVVVVLGDPVRVPGPAS